MSKRVKVTKMKDDKRQYHFSEYQLTVEAENEEEALKKVKKLSKEVKKH